MSWVPVLVAAMRMPTPLPSALMLLGSWADSKKGKARAEGNVQRRRGVTGRGGVQQIGRTETNRPEDDLSL